MVIVKCNKKIHCSFVCTATCLLSSVLPMCRCYVPIVVFGEISNRLHTM